MIQTRTIEIDFDVHQKIETARRSFAEAPNDVLRRLLGLSEASTEADLTSSQVVQGGRPWSWKGVTLPHGTELRMDYNGKEYSGSVENGSWVVEGKEANSPSEAAGLVAQTKDGKKPSLNGWNYWQVKRPGERSWKSLQSLKKH